MSRHPESPTKITRTVVVHRWFVLLKQQKYVLISHTARCLRFSSSLILVTAILPDCTRVKYQREPHPRSERYRDNHNLWPCNDSQEPWEAYELCIMNQKQCGVYSGTYIAVLYSCYKTFSINPSPWRQARAAWILACFFVVLGAAGWNEPEGRVTLK